MRLSLAVLAMALVVPLPCAAQENEELQRMIQQYEASKNLRIEARIPTILAFANLPEAETVSFVRGIFRKELLPEAKKAALQALAKMEIAESTAALLEIGADTQFDEDIEEGLGAARATEVRDLVRAYARGKGGARKMEDRILAIRVLAHYKDSPSEEVLLATAKDKNPQVRAATARALAHYSSEAALDALTDMLGGDRHRQVQIEAVVGLSQRKDDIPEKVVKKALSSRIWEVRAQAMALLYGKDADWVFKAAAEKLRKDKDWHVKAEAVKVLSAMRQRRCVKALIDAMEDAEGRMLEEIHRSVVILTGMRMAAVHEDWLGWWERNGETFKIRDDEGDLVDRPEDVDPEDQATYYGRVIRSKKVIFIIDFSMSMKEEYTPPGAKKTEEEGKENLVRKIDVAREELKRAIERLKPKVFFNVMFFNVTPQPWREKLVQATPDNRKSAIEFVEKREPFGRTDIFSPLERALGDENVDTIYLLTDGLPTHGKYNAHSLNRLRLAVEELNRHRRVSINTISFGQDLSNAQFLRALAEGNWGEYIAR